MIVVTGTFVVADEDVDEAMGAMKVMMAETAKEEGCIVYRFYPDIEESGHFRVYEEWQTETALRAHFNAPHMGVFREKLSKINLLSREVKMFEAGQITEL